MVFAPSSLILTNYYLPLSEALGNYKLDQGRLTLFSPTQVGIATCLTTPLGGLSLLAINYVRVGKYLKAIATLIGGTFLLLLISSLYDITLDWLPVFIPFVISVMVMHYLADKLQGKLFLDNH